MSEKEGELLDLSALLDGPPAEPTSHLHALPPEVEPLPSPENIVAEIATYAKNASIGHPPLTPKVPHTLRISGLLAPHHRARLLDLIKAADLGLREMDLEPQLESGQILLTRISEYVGIQIVQALRDAPVRMTLSPDDDDPDLLPPAA